MGDGTETTTVVLPRSVPCPVEGCKRHAELMGALTDHPYFGCVRHGTIKPNPLEMIMKYVPMSTFASLPKETQQRLNVVWDEALVRACACVCASRA